MPEIVGMKRMAVALVLAAAAAAAAVGGEEGSERPQDGLQVEDAQCFYQDERLFLWVALVEDTRKFLEEWRNPSRAENPEVRTRALFRSGDIVFPAIMFSTDSLSPEGKADIIYSFVFRRPDGSIYEKMENLVVVDDAPPKGIGLCKGMSGLEIEPSDPPGEYTLEVSITDRIRDKTVKMPFRFVVTKEPAGVEPRKPAETAAPEGALRVTGETAGKPEPRIGHARSAWDGPAQLRQSGGRNRLRAEPSGGEEE